MGASLELSRFSTEWKVSRADWDVVVGGAVRIAVDPDGNAWVVNNEGKIFAYDPLSNSFQFVNTGRALDIAINKSDRDVLAPGIRDASAREVVVALIDVSGGIWRSYQDDPKRLRVAPHWVYLRRQDILGPVAPLTPFTITQGELGSSAGLGVDPQGHVWVSAVQNKYFSIGYWRY